MTLFHMWASKTSFPSAIFRRVGYTNTVGRRPLLGLITRKIPPLCNTSNNRRAEGLGIPTIGKKSLLLKIGLSNIQSNARMACCERIMFTISNFMLSYRLRISRVFLRFSSTCSLIASRKNQHQPV